MSYRHVIEHALRVYYADSSDPDAMVRGLLDAYRGEVLRAAADHLARQADELWSPGTTAHTVMHADAAELRVLRVLADPAEPGEAS